MASRKPKRSPRNCSHAKQRLKACSHSARSDCPIGLADTTSPPSWGGVDACFLAHGPDRVEHGTALPFDRDAVGMEVVRDQFEGGGAVRRADAKPRVAA